MLMLCPFCERAGTMTITTAVSLNPVHADADVNGARWKFPESGTAMLSCRACGWRVDGHLDDMELIGRQAVKGSFVADEEPIIPPQ